MSLLFGATNSDRVNFGSGASIDSLTSWTWILWMYPTSNTGSQSFIGKGTGGTAGRKNLERKSSDTDDYTFFAFRSGTDALAETTGVNRPLNAWKYLAMGYDDTDGPRIYHGDLNNAAVEASYSTRTVGTGVIDGDAALDWFVGNSSANTEAFVGRIAVVQIFAANIGIGRIRQQQFKPRNAQDCRLLCHLGYNGVSTQYDLSGNENHGTVTGATQAPHVPLGAYI